jgi:hypothetical protein
MSGEQSNPAAGTVARRAAAGRFDACVRAAPHIKQQSGCDCSVDAREAAARLQKGLESE